MIFTNIKLIDDLISLGFLHPYISILLLGIISIIVGVVIMLKNTEKKEDKPSVLGEFFSNINSILKE